MRRFWLVLVLAVVVGTLLPGGCAPLRELALLHVNDKVQHFVAYAVLACVPVRAASRGSPFRRGIWLLMMGVALELLQAFVPGRSCELMDGVWDAAGVVVGGLFGGSCTVLRASISRTRVAAG